MELSPDEVDSRTVYIKSIDRSYEYQEENSINIFKIDSEEDEKADEENQRND